MNLPKLRVVVCGLVFACVCTVSTRAGEPAACAPFADGDTVCFVGDSITHTGGYIKVLRDFYALVFPERKITLVNCGISGDSLPGVLGRLADDVLAHQPTVVFFMLGMNDVGRDRFGPGKPAPTAGDSAIAAYAQNLRKLAERMKTAGVKTIVLMSPTIYDEYATGPRFQEPKTGCDSGLAFMTERVRQCAAENGWGFIDQHKAMVEWSARLRAKDPRFSFHYGDRTHPMLSGHYLMAAQILQAQGVWGTKRRLRLTPAGEANSSCGFRVEAPRVEEGGLAATVTAQGLPLVVSPELDSVPELREEYRQAAPCTLICPALAEGSYQVRFDEMAGGIFTAQQLADGVELSAVAAFPGLLRAVRVYSLDAALTDYEVEAVRDVRAALRFLQGERNANPQLPSDNLAAARQILASGKNGYVPGLYRKLVEYGAPEKKEQIAAEFVRLTREIQSARAEWSLRVRVQPAKRERSASSPEKVPDAGAVREFPASEAVMVSAWRENRLQGRVNGDKLEIAGAGAVAKKVFVRWQLPPGLPAERISKAEIVITPAYSQRLQNLQLGAVNGGWVPQAVNYYYQPLSSPEVTVKLKVGGGDWIFDGDRLRDLVRGWATGTIGENGIWLATEDVNAFGAFSQTAKPPLLRIVFSPAGQAATGK